MNGKWVKIQEFEKILDDETESFEEISNKGMTLISLYAFYHYFNADVTKMEELLSGMVIKDHVNLHILGIYPSLLDDKSVDFISMMSEDFYKDVFVEDIDGKLKNLAQKMAYIIVKTPFMDNEDAIDVYTSINCNLTDDNYYTNRILCDFEIPVEQKFKIQKIVSEYTVKQKNIKFEILFRDDIQEEIDDIESPKEFVAKGQLKLVNRDSFCFFGKERSFISMISANSLKKAFYDYGNKGLLDSNLRFFVSSKKIDPKIVYSIQNEPENFCYYNNGIIVTCDNYSIKDSILELENFSIVNGGQTTNLIGRTEFEDDFPVICKVIKNKYNSVEQRVEFLSKVAEASNTQKPINAKDLIANRKEQRLLKLQFERAGIFLRVKRGEKIDKSIYKSNWQNASNDEVAQFIYSMVFQCPGASKNSKSKLLETEKIYRTIFNSPYQDGFFVSIQHIKVAYSEWLKKLKKTEAKSSVKYALAKNALLMTMATYGLVYKTVINDELRTKLLDENDVSYNNINIKLLIQQNDIGQTNIFRKEYVNKSKWNNYYALFELLFGYILIPAYEQFKKNNPTYAYSHFVKSDSHYYNFVVPQVISLIENTLIMDDLVCGTESQKIKIDYESIKDEQDVGYKPGLEQELIDLRRKIYHESNKQIQAYEVISNRQLASVMKYLPKTEENLNRLCGMKVNQTKQYGDMILSIINKYTNIEDII